MGWFQKSHMGEDARDHVARNCKEGVDPRSDIEDYGDHDEDYSEQQKRASDGWGGNPQRYHENNRTNTVKIRDRK